MSTPVNSSEKETYSVPKRMPPPLPPRNTSLHYMTPPTASSDTKPPVPTTPRPTLLHKVSQPSPVHNTKKKTSRRTYPNTTETFTLKQLVDKHAKSFPLKVKVEKGFFGSRGEDSVIPSGEIYNMYFVKKTKVVTVSDSTNCKYVVPINSASRFGLLYKSSSVNDEDHLFETVEDILLCSILPKVVCAQVAYQGRDESSSVHKNEILVIKGTSKARGIKAKIRSAVVLKVLSLKTYCEKLLPKEVYGRFTTDPQNTQMYLPELLKYVDDPLPSSARLFLDYDSGDPLPDYLVSGIVKLEKQYVETSILASQVFEDEEDEQQHQPYDEDSNKNKRMVDIPITLDIEVKVIPIQDDDNESDYEQLYDDAQNLANQFDFSQADHFDAGGEYSYVAQTRFYNAVRKGHEKEGLDILLPADRFTANGRPLSSESSDYVGPDDDYDTCSFPLNQRGSLSVSSSMQSLNSIRESSGSGQFRGPPDVLSQSTSSLNRIQRVLGGSTPHINSPTLTSPTTKPPLPPVAPRRTSRSSLATSTIFEHPSPSPSTSDDYDVATNIKLPPRRILSSEPPANLEPPADLAAQVKDLKQSLQDITQKVYQMERESQELKELKKELTGLKPLTNKLQASCDSLRLEVKSLMDEMLDMKKQMKNMQAPDSREEDVFLENIDHNQILQLLDSLKLSKYKHIFKERSIDGAYLSQCDEEVLERNLGIKSRLDRIRIMSVINGKKLKLVFGQGGNYVFLEKPH